MRFAVVAGLIATLIGSAALAQEQEPPSPWKPLDGRNAGAVGNCPPIDGEWGTGVCYLVRCEAGRLVFVIQDKDLDRSDVHSVRFELGRFAAVISLERPVPDEGVVDLGAHADLLRALETNSRHGMGLETVDAANGYYTNFGLERARQTIARLKPACPLRH